ncbi:MAG: DnaA N-terminal domain-containing protein [Rickettsia endosymbiont of Pentastiridius leporinus]
MQLQNHVTVNYLDIVEQSNILNKCRNKSDDSINSLTIHNNQYTLLYPDLVQELFNFTLHNSNSSKNNALFFGGLGVNNTKNSSIDSSLSASLGSVDSSLSPREILFFLQIVSLYQLELSKGNNFVVYSSLKLAKILGINSSCCSESSSFCDDVSLKSYNSSTSSNAANMRSTILKMTAKLESLGLLNVFRRKRKNGMDNTNRLVPVLPDYLYNNIKDSPANLSIRDHKKLDLESNLERILRTKLFVPIELAFMKSLFKDKMSSKYKLFFLNCIMSAYRNFRQSSSSIAEGYTLDVPNMLSFSATSSELMKKNNLSYSTLKRIFKYVKQQGDSFFLQVEHKYTKSDDIDSNRYDKSIFVISINPLVFPISHISQIKQSQTDGITNYNCDELQDKVLPIFPDTYKGFETGGSKKQPRRVKKAAHNNKEEIIKNKYSRNIDENCENLENPSVSHRGPILTPEENYKKEFLEEEQSSSSSKFYNNSSFLNGSSRENNQNISKQKKEWRELRQFYPLSEKDVDMLNSRAHREFSNNFVNQLLLKLYIKYPEKRFKNRFTFLSYMAQILKHEKHQGPLVNHVGFRFSCNIETTEKNLLEQEKYLNQIEDSLDTSKEIQLKKKIAGRFSTEVAYNILTKVQFKLNHDNSLMLALVPKHLDLSERQIEILSEQLEAVYGINGYYVQEEEQETLPTKSRTPNVELNGKSTKNTTSSNTSSEKSEEILENTMWHQIRKGLKEELGAHIDEAWFAKAEAKECKDTKTLTITMPTRFMSDWVKNNYSHVIRRLAGSLTVKNVEYSYE